MKGRGYDRWVDRHVYHSSSRRWTILWLHLLWIFRGLDFWPRSVVMGQQQGSWVAFLVEYLADRIEGGRATGSLFVFLVGVGVGFLKSLIWSWDLIFDP